MPTISPRLREQLHRQQADMLADDSHWCPFDDPTLALAWRRSEDLDDDDAMAWRHELLELSALIEAGAVTANTTAVAIDELLKRGFTRQRIKQLDDDGLLPVVWDRPETRRSGYVLRVELDGLPARLRAQAEGQARQRKLRCDYIAGRKSKLTTEQEDELPDFLR